MESSFRQDFNIIIIIKLEGNGKFKIKTEN